MYGCFNNNYYKNFNHDNDIIDKKDIHNNNHIDDKQISRVHA